MRLFNSGKALFHPEGLVVGIGSGWRPALETDVVTDAEPKAIEEFKKRDDRIALVVNGLATPFKDKSFDYAICSHLAEHLEPEEIEKLFSELFRIAPKGYLEVPSLYWELLHNCDRGFYPEDRFDTHHKQYCFYHEGVLHFIRKQEGYDPRHKILWQLFLSVLNDQVVGDNINLFMIGLEWKHTIPHQFHRSFDVVPEALFDAMMQQLVDYKKNLPKHQTLRKLRRHLFAPLRSLREKFDIWRVRQQKKRLRSRINLDLLLK